MLTQTEARIYLSGNRIATSDDGFCSLHTLGAGDSTRNEPGAFRSLLAFNEQTLLSGKQTSIIVSRPIEIILIPVAGGIELLDSHDESIFVGVGETFHFSVFPESRFRVSNPYPNEQITYIQLHLSPVLFSDRTDPFQPLTAFSLDTPDILVPVFSDALEKTAGFLGKYGGRREDTYKPLSSSSGLFVFVVQGAFEVQNRLLEAGDALSLLHVDSLEFEALSNEAIILVIDLL